MLDCNKPNIGEQIVKDYLESLGYTVNDVSKDPQYWSRDIDIIAIRGNEETKIEVKFDRRIHETHNLYIEIFSDVDNNKGGWFDSCEADELYYIDAVEGTCYIIPLEDLKDYINTHNCIVGECDDKYKRSRGILVNAGVMAVLYNLKIIDLGDRIKRLRQKQTI